ncbi:MAG TPA: phosphoribosylformylglycinamidine synthase subunit PurQ [Vicinamibacterales bacterium]|jgi:phosphoribosylformylglycinamidine synthase
MQFSIVVFPGSNREHDAWHVARHVLGESATYVHHKESDLKGADAVILPGGFAYGDYLRTGAIARFSPIMGAVRAFAERGGPVIGICNGFQVLVEAGLLPGALLRNERLKFICDFLHLRVDSLDTPFTRRARPGQVLCIPVAHGEGRYFADPDALAQLERQQQVVFRYTDPEGRLDPAANPNGSVNAIAGICNAARNVVGMMPHPEDACETELGSRDGLVIFESVLDAVASGVGAHGGGAHVSTAAMGAGRRP